MNILRKLAGVVATVVAATLLNAGSAAAINTVPCPPGQQGEFTRVWMHPTGRPDSQWCFANGGTYWIPPDEVADRYWVTKIWTGNNRVQWYGDGRWQPAQPINKWTTMRWPNHPGGVRIEAIRIV